MEPMKQMARKSRLVCILVTVFALPGIYGCTAPPQQEQAEWIRRDHPEFEKHITQIVLDERDADEAKRPLGDTVMTLHGTVRNFSGRTLTGLEIWGAVVDLEGNVIKERTVPIIPNRRPELENNQTMKAQILMEGFTTKDQRADIRLEIHGFRFK